MMPPEFVCASHVPVAQFPKEKPILYAGPMVRAVLRDADPKKQTRREIARLAGFGAVTEFDRSDSLGYDWHFRDSAMRWHDISHARLMECCPYGQSGDRLWVRETTLRVEDHGYVGPVYVESDKGRACLEGGLAPSEDDCTEVEPYEIKKRPAIHMPRAMSRIDLEINSVRVERLQDISEAEAIAEGIEKTPSGLWSLYRQAEMDGTYSPRASFRALWESIHGPGSWTANPWVWVVSFRRLTP